MIIHEFIAADVLSLDITSVAAIDSREALPNRLDPHRLIIVFATDDDCLM